MKILAIDQSYTSSGIVVFNDTLMIHAERFATNAELDTYDRAWEAATYMKRVADDYKPDIVALEGLAFNMVGDATRNLAGLQYTIVLQMRKFGNYKVEIIPPNTVKKVATGKGNAKKEALLEHLPNDVKKYFIEKLGAKKTKGLYDLTDAYWIGQSAYQLYKKEEKQQE